MDRKFPNIRGMVDERIENEFRAFANHLYDMIENLAQKADVDLSANKQEKASATSVRPVNAKANQNSSVGLDKNTFAQPVLGQGSDPLLKTATPDDVIHSNMNITVGAVPVGGTLTITDGFGHSVDILTK